MADKSITVDDLGWSKEFRNIKTQSVYIIINLVKCKHPETDQWYNAVVYADETRVLWYVRSYDSFIDKFEKI